MYNYICCISDAKLIGLGGITPGISLDFKDDLRLPKGKVTIEYYNYSDHPFSISIPELGISYSALPGEIGAGSVSFSVDKDTTTTLRIYCPSNICNGAWFVFSGE